MDRHAVSADDSNRRQISQPAGLGNLRRLLLSSGSIEVHDDQLTFDAEGQTRRLVQNGSWLLVQPGTWIFFDQVESVRFEQRQSQIWMHLTGERGEWEAIVGDAG